MSEKLTPVQQVMDETPDNLSIIFNEEVQNAILGYLVQDEKFFAQSLGKILPSYFNSPINHQLLDVQLELYKELKRFPTITEILNHGKIKTQTPEEQSAVSQHLNKAFTDTKKVSLEYLKPRLTDWMHQLLLKKFLRNSLQKYGGRDFKDVFYEMNNIKKLREEFSYEDVGEISFENPEEWIKDSETNFQAALPTGLKLLDQSLLEGATVGSLLPANTTCVMSPTDGGKTSFEFTVLCHNLIAGKDVLLTTHEGSPEELRERLLCCMLTLMGLGDKITPFEDNPFVNRLRLIHMNKSVAGRALIKYATGIISDHLVYHPYNRPGMMVEDVEPIIRRQQDKRITTRGKGFDLFVNDYPAKLGSKRGSQGFLPHHIELGYVYDYFVQMAIEFKWHCLVAVQTNREGYKTNNRNTNAETSRLLTIDDVADAYIISNLVTNFLSINRDPVSAKKDRVTFYLCKSKNSATGRAITCKSRYGCRVTHDDNLGCVGYDDSIMFGEEIDLVLNDKSNLGKVLTTKEIFQYGVITSAPNAQEIIITGE